MGARWFVAIASRAPLRSLAQVLRLIDTGAVRVGDTAAERSLARHGRVAVGLGRADRAIGPFVLRTLRSLSGAPFSGLRQSYHA
jgi:hypothetical protein